MKVLVNNMSFTIAFIGLGVIAQKFHLQAISSLADPGSTVILCDPNIRNRERAFSLTTSLLPSNVNIICMEQATNVSLKYSVDYAIVSSPTFMHFEHCKLFLMSGANVFCEKPLALNVEDASELFRLANSLNLSLQVGYHQRFRYETKYLKKLLTTSGQQISSVKIEQKRFNSTPTYSSWYSKHSLSGGLVFDLASHYFDLLSFLLGFVYPADLKPRLKTCEFNGSNLNTLVGEIRNPHIPYIEFSFSYDCGSIASSTNFILLTNELFSSEWPSCVVKGKTNSSNCVVPHQIISEAAKPHNYASLKQLAYFLKSSGRPPAASYVAENLSLINLCSEIKALADLQAKF